MLKRIRDAINTETAFGSDAFMKDAEEKLGRPVCVPMRGRPPKVVTEKFL